MSNVCRSVPLRGSTQTSRATIPFRYGGYQRSDCSRADDDSRDLKCSTLSPTTSSPSACDEREMSAAGSTRAPRPAHFASCDRCWRLWWPALLCLSRPCVETADDDRGAKRRRNMSVHLPIPPSAWWDRNDDVASGTFFVASGTPTGRTPRYWYWMYIGRGRSASTSRGASSASPFFVSL